MEKVIFFLAENTSLTAEEKEFANRLNQVLLIYDELKDDLFKKDDEILDFEIIRNLFDCSFRSNGLQIEFSNDLEIENKSLFDEKRKIIATYNAPETINMGIDSFREFVQENNISTIFVSTKVNTTYYDLFLDEELCSFYDSEDEQIVCKILQKYVSCYNNILKRLNLEVLTEKKYFCLFNNFAFGYVKKGYTYSLNGDHILSAIAIMCKDEINEALEIFKKLQQQKEQENGERIQREKREQALQTDIAIHRLEEKILNDEKFAICRSEKDRGMYLRNILEEETYDVIAYLEMERMSTGKIRAKGIKGKQFINSLWKKLITKA